MRFWVNLFALSVLLCFVPSAHSQNLGFDLAGPPVDVKVERGGKTLPISEVPSLLPGDRLWVHPDFPDSQSVHYLVIVAFLRGSTNPPPDEWFTKAESWDRSVREEGIYVQVPPEAQQALIFLAPQTTGDFSTLRGAVRGRPGAFVRASQDLQAASFDRARLDRYLQEVKSTSENDPKELEQRTVLLARSLKMKLDPKCFDRPNEQQYSCLTQNSDQLVLDDASTQSMLQRVANGATADLMNQISYSRIAGAGAYSAYVGAIIDFARIMGSMHSAHYQYIPALAVPHADSLKLRLNNPPSFRKPKSVLVVALPPVHKAVPPPLQSLQGSDPYCIGVPDPVLPADGAPLVFATSYAHDLYLLVEDGAGKSFRLPVIADPGAGGFRVNTKSIVWTRFDAEATGTLHGIWGFDHFVGPKFRLQIPHAEEWTVAPSDKTALIVGRDDVLHLFGENVGCVSGVGIVENRKTKPLTWKALKPRRLEIHVPLTHSEPGPITIAIRQHGLTMPDEILVQSYAEAAQFDRFSLHAGDPTGTLEGKRLDEVDHLQLMGVRFEPADLNRRSDHDELVLQTHGDTDELQAAELSAKVYLRDGRTFKLPASVLPPRPKISLISKGVQTDDPSPSPVQIGSPDELPTTGRIVFSVKCIVPADFARGEEIEVASADNSFKTMLKLSDGSLVLQDAQTALGIIDPKKAFGTSAFGPLRFRAIAADGTPGDWLPLGTLVRLPAFSEIACQHRKSKTCSLTGSDLFLLSSVSTDQDFDNATDVPDGFTGQTLTITHPANGSFFFKLRDDPDVVQTATVPVVRDPSTPAASSRTAVQENRSAAQ